MGRKTGADIGIWTEKSTQYLYKKFGSTEQINEVMKNYLEHSVRTQYMENIKFKATFKISQSLYGVVKKYNIPFVRLYEYSRGNSRQRELIEQFERYLESIGYDYETLKAAYGRRIPASTIPYFRRCAWYRGKPVETMRNILVDVVGIDEAEYSDVLDNKRAGQPTKEEISRASYYFTGEATGQKYRVKNGRLYRIMNDGRFLDLNFDTIGDALTYMQGEDMSTLIRENIG